MSVRVFTKIEVAGYSSGHWLVSNTSRTEQTPFFNDVAGVHVKYENANGRKPH